MFGVPWSNCHCSANISGSEEESSWQLYAADSDSNQPLWVTGSTLEITLSAAAAANLNITLNIIIAASPTLLMKSGA